MWQSFVQRDAAEEILTFLESVPWLAGVPVTLLTDHSLSIHNGPYIVVSSDGTSSGNRATATELIRVAVFSKWRPEARDIAARVDALLLNPKTPLGFQITQGPGLMVAKDESIKGFVAAVTVRAAAPKKGMNL